MIPEIEQRRAELEALCRRFSVRRLELVGSAATGAFQSATSDLDFLVEFAPPIGTSIYWKPSKSCSGGRWTWLSLLPSRTPIFASRSKRPGRCSTRVEAKKYLHDIRQAAEPITRFTAGKTLADDARDALLRSAAERQFEIIGEALAQRARLDEALAARLTHNCRIIAFRNILIHGYAEIDDWIVWDVVEWKLPALLREVSALLEER